MFNLLFSQYVIFAEERFAYIDLEYVFQNSNLKLKSDKKLDIQKQKIFSIKKKAESALHQFKKELRQLEVLLGHSEYIKEFERRKQRLGVYEKELSDLKKRYSKWYKNAQADLFEELLIAIETISEKEGVHIVFSKDPAVIFSDESLDISEKVIDFLDDINQRESITVK